MRVHKIPVFCQPCIDRMQTACLHHHTSRWGGFHYEGGEAWDDIREICDDCGADLSELPYPDPSPDCGDIDDPLPF